MRVGLLAPPLVPVPPPGYGGTEAVVDQLAQGIVAAGHEVVLFTTGDSTCPVERRSILPAALGFEQYEADQDRHVRAGYAELADCDVIHDHTFAGAAAGLPARSARPVVVTSHGPFTPDVIDVFRSLPERAGIVAISWSQRREAGELPVAAVIHHGVDPAAFPVGDGGGGYVAFVGRMAPDKGAHRAITAARAAGLPVRLAGKIREPAEREYFDAVVRPLLGPDAEYVGELDHAEKLALFGGAVALAHPIQWPEPFGMVAIEALACGTPVVAFPEGAVPEIVESGRTGVLCTDEADLANGLIRALELDRADCRAAVEHRFSTARMVTDHLALYRRVVEGSHSPVDARCPEG